MYIRSSRGNARVPLITPSTPTRTIKKVSTPARPGTMRCSRSVQKNFYLSGKQQFPGGHADAIGRRPTMEDACVCVGEFAGPKTQFYAVYDGHGGKEAANYCAEKLHQMIATSMQNNYVRGEPLQPLIKKSILEINQNVLSRFEYAGTTAAIAIIIDNTIYTANVGDSRVVLINNGKAKRLSVDHKATAPKERRLVVKRGGSIFQGRVNGILMLSRAIGDAPVARFISADPYMTETTLEEGMKLILACDGVWDVMSDQNAADIFLHSSEPVDAARAIKTEALKRGSTDNVSVICVDLKYKSEEEQLSQRNQRPRLRNHEDQSHNNVYDNLHLNNRIYQNTQDVQQFSQNVQQTNQNLPKIDHNFQNNSQKAVLNPHQITLKPNQFQSLSQTSNNNNDCEESQEINTEINSQINAEINDEVTGKLNEDEKMQQNLQTLEKMQLEHESQQREQQNQYRNGQASERFRVREPDSKSLSLTITPQTRTSSRTAKSPKTTNFRTQRFEIMPPKEPKKTPSLSLTITPMK
ncbi:hypothetical protein TRFO_28498 [Tritrichomonas foetus]|uniref:PPM-type phosphatase domain-containing protein n=1 Tax=Tritrichomonas foetus TaxID=1144522 RepID=A0A1J4K2T7_9EUKA|nr:hypothetical protein TRFO_28498 [Tritrichomonas foetus]|eukprot:OHT04060.1 hypothetical protein TRFO_28498 [Tritrichomonas foetus]